MVTIRDIAREAGVSTMMVSRVINKHYDQVSAENIERIEKIIKKHNYIPNSAARSLSSKASRIISIFIQGDAAALTHPYNAAMLGYLISDIQAKGYDAMTHIINDYSDVLDKLQSWRAAGAVFFGMFEQDILQIQGNVKVPLVFTDCYSDSRQFANVGIDDYGGGRLAAQHLLDYGHKNIAITGEYLLESPLAQQRLKGFKDTLSAAGIELAQDHIISMTHDDPNVVQKLLELKGEHLAVFALSDILSLAIIHRLSRHGYNIPGDFSIIGFDDLYIRTLVYPGLTTIAQDIAQKSKSTVELLFQYLKYPDMPVQSITLDVKLMNRSTVKKLV